MHKLATQTDGQRLTTTGSRICGDRSRDYEERVGTTCNDKTTT